MTEPLLEVQWGAATNTGIRPHNEDRYLTARPVFLVADGMGGHRNGDVAATQVVEAFGALAERDWLDPLDLHAAIGAAGERIRALGTGRGAPGSTVSGVGLTESGGVPCWLVFNIGDSRVYRIQADTLEQISVDHSEAEELRQAGQVDAARRTSRNVITRALGAGQRTIPEADQWLIPALGGDRLLICTDGLTGELTDQLIEATLLTRLDPQTAADDLVRAAVAAGGRDNVTAIVLDAVRVLPEPLTPMASTGGPRHAVTPDWTLPGEEVRDE